MIKNSSTGPFTIVADIAIITLITLIVKVIIVNLPWLV